MLDTKQNRKIIESLFPLLARGNWRVSSDCTDQYNCIAWAADRNDTWLEPTTLRLPGISWPQNIPRNFEPETLIALFVQLGYQTCNNSAFELGFEKVALYAKIDVGTLRPVWSHASKQIGKNTWISKLGQSWDIEHGSPEAISGTEYGIAYCFMKRPVSKNTT